jgi:hypothetical protein
MPVVPLPPQSTPPAGVEIPDITPEQYKVLMDLAMPMIDQFISKKGYVVRTLWPLIRKMILNATAVEINEAWKAAKKNGDYSM